jgi:hypothetical protein
MYSAAEQGAHSYVLPMFMVIVTYTTARNWECTRTVPGRCVTEDSRRISHTKVSLVLIFLIRYLHFVFVTPV